MVWNGFQEVFDFAAKWNLKKSCVKELIDFIMLEYNAGANDLLEYLENNGKIKTEDILLYVDGQP